MCALQQTVSPRILLLEDETFGVLAAATFGFFIIYLRTYFLHVLYLMKRYKLNVVWCQVENHTNVFDLVSTCASGQVLVWTRSNKLTTIYYIIAGTHYVPISQDNIDIFVIFLILSKKSMCLCANDCCSSLIFINLWNSFLS